MKDIAEGEITHIPYEHETGEDLLSFPFKLNGVPFFINCTINRENGRVNSGDMFYTLGGKKNEKDLEQVIKSMNDPAIVPISVMWIGDIDRDNFPDFIMELSGVDDANTICLFLSSKAGSDELVRMVAFKKYFVDEGGC